MKFPNLMQRRAASILVILFLAANGLVGCSSRSPMPEAAGSSAAPREASTPLVANDPSDESTPFHFEILRESNDGSNLNVLVRVEPKAGWDSTKSVVRLTTLRSGEIKETKYFPVAGPGSYVREERTDHGPTYLLSLAMPSVDVTDYQVEFLWGNEAEGHLGAPPVEAAGILALKDIKVESIRCESYPCQTAYRVSARLSNESSMVVSRAKLGIGFVWVEPGSNLDLSTAIPENETFAELSGLSLTPGNSRPIRLTLDREVTAEKEGGGLRPVVRVVSFE